MIKRIFKNALLLVIVSSFANSIFAQLYPDSLLTQLGEKYPQEKIYLHTDKSYYNAGETIWFKAYLLSDNFITALSKTVYAELLDEKGSILQKKMMPVYQSGAASNFDLPDTITNTRVYIRAYTSWMLNFDSSLLYLKSFQIIPAANTAKKSTAVAITYSLTLFPEAGDLVENISSRVAFKATDNEGIPVFVSGNITDAAGKKITGFAAVHNGMGYFSIIPAPGEKYKAVWKDKKGEQHETLLPDAKKQSVALSVSSSADTINFTLQRPENAEEAFLSYTVVAQMQLQRVYSAKINLSKRTAVTAPIITTEFPDGVLQLTVFNAALIPVAERLVFVNHNNYYFITDLHAVEKNLTKHGHNTLQIDVSDTMVTNLSVAVTDAGINPVTKNEDNIFSTLLLTTDLKGYVYNPAYYFSSDADSVKKHLDLVMMTNGWRRFKWENLLAQQWPKISFPIDNYISVKGNVYGLSKTQLAKKDLIVYIKTKSNTSDFILVPLSADGQFRLTGMYLFDTAKLYYQVNNDKDKKLTAAASFSFKNEIPNLSPASQGLLASLLLNTKTDSLSFQKSIKLAALQRSLFENRAKTLETVKIFSKQKSLKEKLEEQYTSGFFSGADGYTFTMEDDPFAKSALTVMDYLRGKVAGMQVSSDGQSVSWRGSSTSVFLNETNSDIGMVQSIPMTDIAMIKVYRPPFFGASGGGAGGAIAIYTKKGGADNSSIKGLDFTNIYGYSAIKEFYMPDYEKTNTPDTPDYRSTLYWSPYTIIDKKTRRIKIPFYNTDNCKKIRVVIEGINSLGQLTREEKFFE